MKKITGLQAVSVTLALLAFSVFASANATTLGSVVQDQCTPENKLAWYNEFRQVYKTDTAKANEVAQKYLACPTAAGEEQIANYLKTFVAAYQKSARKSEVTSFVYDKKEYIKGIELAKQVIAEEPDYLRSYIDMAYAGYTLATTGNATFAADSLNAAKKAIQMIEGGTALEVWKPFSGRNEALSWLYYIAGTFTITSSPADAIPYLIKTANTDGPFKKIPQTYLTLAQAYEVGVYAKMSEEYTQNFKDKPETPESKLALANINQVVERIIDANARAVNLAGTDPKNKKVRDDAMASLTNWYKYLYPNEPETKVNEFVATIMSTPLPPQPTPLTSLPAAAPSTTPTSGNGASSAQPTASPAPAGTPKPGASDSTSVAKPAATTAKPNTSGAAKPRRNHRRG